MTFTNMFDRVDSLPRTVPQEGDLLITTEFGRLLVSPGEIVVIQVPNFSVATVL